MTYFTPENIKRMESGYCVPATNPVRKLHIQAPKIETKNGLSRLSCTVLLEDEPREIWFEVEEKYGKYLCDEHADAILIGLLNWAMRERCDIVCDVPVTEELFYQITTYLVPALARSSKRLYETKIFAKTDFSPLPRGNGVGTGISCGVDSMHAVAANWKSPFPSTKLTHLVLNNVGAFVRNDNDAQYHWQTNHVKKFCKEYGFEFILTNSNLAYAFPRSHLQMHTYSNCFAVYMLQKFWKTFFYSSSGDGPCKYALENSEFEDAAYYDALSLPCFSTRDLKIYSDGAAIDRFEKTKKLIDFVPAQKYLHVCTSDKGGNCNRCGKCKRTLVILDALDALDKFRAVFDIDYYKKHRSRYLCWLLLQEYLPHGDHMVHRAFLELKKEIPFWAYPVVWAFAIKSRIFSFLAKFEFLKKIYRTLKSRKN